MLIVACFRSIRAVDRTRDLEPPEIPAKLDPYEVAYLRGGENEVTRVAIASMIQRGLLQIIEQKTWIVKTKKIDRGREPEPRELVADRSHRLEMAGVPRRSTGASSSPNGIARRGRGGVRAIRGGPGREGLLAPPEMKGMALRLWSFGLAARSSSWAVQAGRRPSRRGTPMWPSCA